MLEIINSVKFLTPKLHFMFSYKNNVNNYGEKMAYNLQ